MQVQPVEVVAMRHTSGATCRWCGFDAGNATMKPSADGVTATETATASLVTAASTTTAGSAESARHRRMRVSELRVEPVKLDLRHRTIIEHPYFLPHSYVVMLSSKCTSGQIHYKYYIQ